MNRSWEKIGLISAGGTVFDLCGDIRRKVWLASPVGLFYGEGEVWRPAVRGFPFVGANAVIAAGKKIFVAGGAGGIVHTQDSGYTWRSSWITQTEAPITCLASSPNYHQDGVLLAGTESDGILRSTDGGRIWELSNFGLREFTVLALAAASQWDRREYVFASTEGGLYVSPNGGRAWRRSESGLEGKIVISLAVSPEFAKDGIVFAGTDWGEVHRSIVRGRTWQKLPFPTEEFSSVNSLIYAPDSALLAGTVENGILRSMDDGMNWETVWSGDASVLRIVKIGDEIFAGLHDEGILISNDGGLTWEPVRKASARRFNWLRALPSGRLVAVGLIEGLWISEDTADNWSSEKEFFEGLSINGITLCDDAILVATSSGLLAVDDYGIPGEPIWNHESEISALTSAGEQIWIADTGGKLWHSANYGLNWGEVKSHFGGSMVIALGASPDFKTDNTLVAVVNNRSTNQIQVQRSLDAGQSWNSWMEHAASGYGVRLHVSGTNGERTIVGLGAVCLIHTTSGWQIAEIGSTQAPVTALLDIESENLTLAATIDGIQATWDGKTWQIFNQGIEGIHVVDMTLSPNYENDHTIYALTFEGEVWKKVVD